MPTTAHDRPRVPAGVAAGGRYTAAARPEPPLDLRAKPPADPSTDDQYGFPTIACPRCGGTRESAYNPVTKTRRCFKCNGTGRAYERGVVERAVAEFCAARMAATRPQVRDLRVGDAVSLRYEDLRSAQWFKVAGVLVYPNRPTKFASGDTGRRRPIAYAAVVELDDGSAIQTTTDTVVARRGADVDPTPYVERARAGSFT